MQNKLRAAVIGVGYLGQFHAQKYKANADATLVGVCDAYPAQADKIASTLQVDAYYRVEDLIGKIDLATVAASTQAHYEAAKVLLNAGIHVNVEKPITATVSQGEELLQIAKEKNVILSVGHIERYNPTFIEVKKNRHLFNFIELKRLAPFKIRGADVSVLHDLMIHDLDLIRWISESEIETVSASGGAFLTKEIDHASVHVVMKNGWKAHIHVSRVAAAGERSARLTGPQTIWHANSGTLTIDETLISRVESDPLKFSSRTLEKADALLSETEAFVTAVKNKTQAPIPGLDGLQALMWVEKIKEMLG